MGVIGGGALIGLSIALLGCLRYSRPQRDLPMLVWSVLRLLRLCISRVCRRSNIHRGRLVASPGVGSEEMGDVEMQDVSARPAVKFTAPDDIEMQDLTVPLLPLYRHALEDPGCDCEGPSTSHYTRQSLRAKRQGSSSSSSSSDFLLTPADSKACCALFPRPKKAKRQ